MTDLTIGGETFRVDIAGDATRPALLLAHALGTDLTMWDGQIEPLSQHFRVVRYDSRGHGASVGTERPVSLARLGRDALALMDALEIDTAHFIGVSMGGAVGQWLLINAPHRVDRAVLANTAAKLGTPDGWNARIRTAITGGMTLSADATIERWFSPAFARRDPDRVEAVRDVLLGTDPASYAACCAALRDMDLREALREIDRPVLVVTGTDDPVVGEDDLALLVARIGGAAHVALDAKHIANIEAEAAFNAVVVDFLTSKRPRLKAPSKLARGHGASLAPPPRVARPAAVRRAAAARSPLRKLIGNSPTPSKSGDAKPAARRAAAEASKTARASAGTKGAKAPVERTAKKTAVTAPTRAEAATKIKSADKVARGMPAKAPKTSANARRAAVKPEAKASKAKAAVKMTAPGKTGAAKTGRGKTGTAKTGTAKTGTRKAAAPKSSVKSVKKAALAKGGAKPAAKAGPAKKVAGKASPAARRKPAAQGAAGRRRA